MTASRTPPGPPARWLTGHLGELRRDLLGLYNRCAREFGPVAQLRFGLRRVWVVSEPELIEQILTGRHFTKHYALKMMRMLLGDGLLSSEGDFWLRQRRLIQPAFLRDRLDGYAAVMADFAEQCAASWEHGQTRSVYADMRLLTMRIAARTLFGGDVEGEGMAVASAMADIGEAIGKRLFSVFRLPDSIPTPANLRARRGVRRLDAILYKLIDRRRRDTVRGDDLISILLHAREEDGTGMTDRQLRDEAMTLFLAGHETTALALTWALDLLAENPGIQEKLRQELRDVLGDRPPSPADLPRLRLTEMVVMESMRLRPPAYAIGRQAARACEIGGYPIPAGGTVLTPQWAVHRDPRFYDDPERFDPMRWADGLQKRIPKYAYFPFGGGPRVCIGNTFAMMEATLALASLCRRWRFRREGPFAGFRARITLAPAGPVRLAIERA